MSVSGIMDNGTIHELLIPPTIMRKTQFEEYKIQVLEPKNNEFKEYFIFLQSKIQELEKKNDEYEKMIQQHSAMFELLRQRIEVLEKLNKN
jgi:hypothetical protein